MFQTIFILLFNPIHQDYSVNEHYSDTLIFFTNSKRSHYEKPKNDSAYLLITSDSTADYLILGPCSEKINRSSLPGVNFTEYNIQWNGDTLFVGNSKPDMIIFHGSELVFYPGNGHLFAHKYYRVIYEDNFKFEDIKIKRQKVNCFFLRLYVNSFLFTWFKPKRIKNPFQPLK